MPRDEPARRAFAVHVAGDTALDAGRARAEQILDRVARSLPLRSARAEEDEIEIELLLHARVEAVLGRAPCARSQGPVRAQHAPRLVGEVPPAAQSAEHLDQHDGVERRVAERKPLPVGLHQAGRAPASRRRTRAACRTRGPRRHNRLPPRRTASRSGRCRRRDREHAWERQPGRLEHDGPGWLGRRRPAGRDDDRSAGRARHRRTLEPARFPFVPEQDDFSVIPLQLPVQ